MSSVEHVIVTQRSRPAWEYFEYQPDLDISICKVDSVDIQQCGTGKEINKLDKTYLKSRHEETSWRSLQSALDINAAEWYWQQENLPSQQILPTVDFCYLLDCLTVMGLDRTEYSDNKRHVYTKQSIYKVPRPSNRHNSRLPRHCFTDSAWEQN